MLPLIVIGDLSFHEQTILVVFGPFVVRFGFELEHYRRCEHRWWRVN